MRILSIETSCDETAAAVLDDQNSRWLLSSVVASQEAVHSPYGGIIPELACRRHLEVLPDVVDRALEHAGLRFDELNGIAVTSCPGLMGSLLVGLSYAKALSLGLGIPYVGVNHLSGHLAAVMLETVRPEELAYPHLGFIASGGHTSLYLAEKQKGYQLIARTRDDACGEAFDKAAKILDLGYPGGPQIEKSAAAWALANPGKKPAITLPAMRLKSGELGFSFSGLKTAVAQLVQRNPQASREEIAFVFQERVLEALIDTLSRSIDMHRPKALIFSGGVAANARLREGLAQLCLKQGIQFLVPPIKYCTDNAAMIGAAGMMRLRAGMADSWELKARPHADDI